MTAVQEEGSTQLWSCGVLTVELLLCPELWKSSFSSDHRLSLFLPCSRQVPLLSSPDELTQAQECFLPPFSPHPPPLGPRVSKFPICHLPESSQALCPRCICELERGKQQGWRAGAPGPWGSPVSVLGPTPACSVVWLLHPIPQALLFKAWLRLPP